MKNRADVKRLSPSQIFQLTSDLILSKLGSDELKAIDITLPEEKINDPALKDLISLNTRPRRPLARVFIKNGIAHVIYYPGVDTDKIPDATPDIPLKQIVSAVDSVLQSSEFQQQHEFKKIKKIKKHMTVCVYGKQGRENHYVAVTGINNRLTVVNPKGNMLANGTNPDMEYLHSFISDLDPKPQAANIQAAQDTNSCGYIVAAIHAAGEGKIRVSDAEAAITLFETNEASGPAVPPPHANLPKLKENIPDEDEDFQILQNDETETDGVDREKKNKNNEFVFSEDNYAKQQRENQLNLEKLSLAKISQFESLNESLKKYVDSKKGSRAAYDAVKKGFFENIIKLIDGNTLTLKTLFELLTNAKDDLKNLFFTRFRSDVNSGAMQLIKEIFKVRFNLHLSDAGMLSITNVNNFKNFESVMFGAMEGNWRKNPYNVNARVALEHELKGELLFNSAETKDKTLAQTIYAENVNENNFANFTAELETVRRKCPDYMPELIADLYKCHRDATIKIKGFYGHLANLILDQDQLYKDIQNYLVTSDPYLTTGIILQLALQGRTDKAIAIFYNLSPLFQKTVQQNLLLVSRKKPETEITRIASEMKAELIEDARKFVLKADNSIFSLPDKILELVTTAPTKYTFDQNSALYIINSYLSAHPNEYKTNFFTQLKAKMTHESSYIVLENALKTINLDLLFEKFTGRKNSGAAKCINELFRLVSGRSLTDQELDILVTQRKLPDFNALIKEEVNRQLIAPPRVVSTPLAKLVKQTHADVMKLQNGIEVLQRELATNMEEDEAERQNALLQAVFDKENYPYRFDTQGRILTEAKLQGDTKPTLCHLDIANQQEWAEKFKEWATATYELAVMSDDIQPKKGVLYVKNSHRKLEYKVLNPANELVTGEISAEQLNYKGSGALNMDIVTPLLPVILEITSKREHTCISNTFNTYNKKILSDAVDAFMQLPSRSSVIPLEVEMELHMRHSSSVLQHYLGEHYPDIDWPKIHALAADEINVAVRNVFQNALIESNKDGTFNLAKLNQLLDAKRLELAQKSKKALVNACRKVIGENEFKQAYDMHVRGSISKADFSKMTATGEDFFATDASAETALRIKKTKYTAHDKETGIAMRALHRTHFDGNVIRPRSLSAVDARIPSVALINKDHTAAVNGVKDELVKSYEEIQARCGGYTGPMVYNLLTSLHNLLYDRTADNKNQQRKAAARILKGAHLFNHEQVMAGNFNSLCYVQNIAVNQHSTKLGYDRHDDATAEATLMAEIAMLHTFAAHADVLPPRLRSTMEGMYRTVHQLYLNFLNDAAAKPGAFADKYFKDSEQGREVIRRILSFKTYLQQSDKNSKPLKVANNAPLPELITKALMKIMASNQHWDEQYGMLVQSFSLFIENAAIAGCKSANERYLAVSNRVQLLHAIHEQRSHGKELSPEAQTLMTALEKFVNAVNTPDITHDRLNALQSALDIAYNNEKLYGEVYAVSSEDQGAPPKLKASKSKNPGRVGELNTNYAETSRLGFLAQNNASRMQAHNHKDDHASQLTAIVDAVCQQAIRQRKSPALR